MDGTIALEGNGPKTGIPREVGLVGAGSGLVAVDAVFAKLMGFDPRAIADPLFLSVHTIQVYASRIYAKLGVHRRGEAVALAQDLDLI